MYTRTWVPSENTMAASEAVESLLHENRLKLDKEYSTDSHQPTNYTRTSHELHCQHSYMYLRISHIG